MGAEIAQGGDGAFLVAQEEDLLAEESDGLHRAGFELRGGEGDVPVIVEECGV